MSSRPSLLQKASIAFDLDGTLMDTAPGLVDVLNRLLERDGLPCVSFPSFRTAVGRGARFMIEKAYRQAGRPLEPTLVDHKIKMFLEDYDQNLTRTIRLFPGVESALQVLYKAGARLSVCTNKPSVFAEKLIEAAGLAHFFERIIGPERTPEKKPDPRHIERAVDNANPLTTVMVGDTAADIMAAQAYGAASIAMTYGYALTPHEISEADIKLDSFSCMRENIESLLKKPSIPI